MLLMTPGLVIAQHQGGGKAEQIFLRGFDCDHGTDVCANVDGIPVNLVTQAHGQGYADLHFLISETVDEMNVYKGPYFSKFGDFATAGAIDFKTKDILDNNVFKVEGGEFNTQKYTFLYQPNNGGAEQNCYIATQYYHSDGAFVNKEGFQRLNLFGKYFTQLSRNSRLTFSASSYTCGWNASGQIPTRAINEGIISRFGALDNLEGGTTGRQNFNLAYNFKDVDGDELEIQSYLSIYNFKLFSDFTYFLVDSINDDMIEQTENRFIQGLNTKYKFYKVHNKISVINTLSCGYRGDNIDIELWHSPERIRMNVFTNDNIIQRNFNAWYEKEIIFSSKFKVILGLRHDYFTFSKDDKVNQTLDSVNNGLPHGSGFAQKSIFSPKLNFIITPIKNFDIYINSGRGFHSNDARDIVLGQIANSLTKQWKQQGFTSDEINQKLQKYNFDPLIATTGNIPQATGCELGLRTKFFNKLHLGLAGWYLFLEKEMIYGGDGGTTELSNSTQRLGIDAEARYSITSWLWLDADVCFSKGKIDNLPKGENYIPLAPTLISNAGISIMHKSGINFSLRVRHVDNRPANEDNSITALGYTLLNSTISYKYKKFVFHVTAENILNTKWNEAEFGTETRLKGEKTGISDLCFTPGNPRNFQFGIEYKF
jgi:outer membrane receptor protein involved in Fe transport